MTEATQKPPREDVVSPANRPADANIVDSRIIEHLAGGVVHDFKNLLHMVTCSALISMELADDNPEQTQELKKIVQAADRGARMVKKLLNLGRAPTMEAVPLDLNQVILTVVDLLGKGVGEDILFDFKLYSDLGLAFADQDAVEQILINLLLNGRDAMPEGGRLLIETVPSRIDATGYSQISGFEEDGEASREADPPGRRFVGFIVTDGGEGMTREVLERMFDPYYSTKGTHHGSGLGLFMVRTLVRRLQGRVHAMSEPGLGTRIEVWLPAYDEDAHLPSFIGREGA